MSPAADPLTRTRHQVRTPEETVECQTDGSPPGHMIFDLEFGFKTLGLQQVVARWVDGLGINNGYKHGEISHKKLKPHQMGQSSKY